CFKENGQDEIEIGDADSESFTTLLNLLHKKRTSLNKENLMDVLHLAHRFDIKRVIAKCKHSLLSKKKEYLLCEQLIAADRYGLKTVQKKSLRRLEESDDIRTRVVELRESKYWSEYSHQMKSRIFEALR
ncbi:hypothetical protein PFISCL1PPCAC_12399, partial [Pristionchus fissidentatus]